MNFENLETQVAQLPKVEALNFTGLHPDYKAVRLLANLVFFIVLAIGGLLVISFGGFFTNLLAWGLYFLVLVSYVSLTLLVIIKGFSRKGFALRQHDIVFKSGYLFFTQTAMPFNRIQHCELSQGPIEKLYNLCRLNIFTAGGDDSDLVIPGIEFSRGEQLRDYILGKVTSPAHAE